MRLRGEDGYDAKRAGVAMRTAREVDAGDALPESGDGFSHRGARRWRWRLERGACLGEERALIAVGEQPVVADAIEAARQHVKDEAAQEFRRSEAEEPAPDPEWPANAVIPLTYHPLPTSRPGALRRAGMEHSDITRVANRASRPAECPTHKDRKLPDRLTTRRAPRRANWVTYRLTGRMPPRTKTESSPIDSHHGERPDARSGQH